MTGLLIRNADISDLKYIIALQRLNRESVGGLPPQPFEKAITDGTLALSLLNDDPCGYIFYSVTNGILRIHQACIQYDARRRTYGEALWLWVIQRNSTIREARLRCAADIDANLFWRDMGFTCVNVKQGGVRRGRMINCWQRWFTDDQLIPLSDMAVHPIAQVRLDTPGYFDSQTGFISTVPKGFASAPAFSVAKNGLQSVNRALQEDSPALVLFDSEGEL